MVELNDYDKLVVERSLAETLWRLEEVRMGFSRADRDKVSRALDWIQKRQGLEGAYSVDEHRFFAPAEKDKDKVKLITGEKYDRTGGTDHILGQEALRTLILWGRGEEIETKKALTTLHVLLDQKEDGVTPTETGFFCCAKCSVSMLKTVSVVKTESWEKTLKEGILKISKNRDGEGRWKRYPFYYTLLTLSEIQSPEAIDELRYVSKKARSLLKRYKEPKDRESLFRRIGLETAARS
ncbi:MAG: hypothetical protein ACOC85_04685 [Thermoplasmatota archaeon]